MEKFAIVVLRALAWLNLATGALAGLFLITGAQYDEVQRFGTLTRTVTLTNGLTFSLGLAAIFGGLCVWAFFIVVAGIADRLARMEFVNTTGSYDYDEPGEESAALRAVPVSPDVRYRPSRRMS